MGGTAQLLAIGVASLVVSGLGENLLHEEKQSLNVLPRFISDPDDLGEMAGEDDFDVGMEPVSYKSCSQKKKCKKKNGVCQEKGTCTGSIAKGCSRGCSCCLPDPAEVLCSKENGICLTSEDRCDGRIKIINNSCKDNCVCCIPDVPEKCPSGFFKTANSNQCFKFISTKSNSWEEAKGRCETEGLVLAKPEDPMEVKKHIYDHFDRNCFTWIGARGTGPYFVWEQDGEQIPNNDPLWWFGSSDSKTSTDFCLLLLTGMYANHATHAYLPNPCKNTGICTLCEYGPN